MTTAASILRVRADSDATALLFGDDAWTYRELLGAASRRAALFGELRDDGRPPHIGVLLENILDYLFWPRRRRCRAVSSSASTPPTGASSPACWSGTPTASCS